MGARFAVGIDLGTTNSVLGYVPLEPAGTPARVLPVPQLTAPGTVEARPSLPSFLYLAAAGETTASYDLPWVAGRALAAGELARGRSAEAPQQTVASAKSWLCHTRVDRHQAILPWGAPPEAAKVSPVEAAREYLAHLVAAWDSAHPEAPLAAQKVVLTVPASFDASARELTREAALQAGLPPDFTLLEEPQAALYAWLADRGEAWRRTLRQGDTLLVCDIGGGTTDFTLIGVEEEQGELTLRRLAVGNHILVGGDNMDAALAFAAGELFRAQGVEVDAWQSVALWHACRGAKEQLLAPGGPDRAPVTVAGRGRKLVGGTIRAELTAEEVQRVLLEGFLPACAIADSPAVRRSSGFRELGLPFETDVAITKHLARFLRANGADGNAARPTKVLFNGGVLKAGLLRERLLEVLRGWFPGGDAPSVLEGNADLDFAVARGAACYAALKAAGGLRIRGGTARSYYVGIESAGLAVPGAPRPLRALCVAPFGMEEGTDVDVPSEEFGLVVGEPAHFRFFSSAVRKEDRPGTLLSRWTEEELEETDSVETDLPAADNHEDGCVPVRFHAKVTELGLLELWCRSTVSEEQWKLGFRVREDGGA